jgi:predicted short-subunit dehydrogenase-like oxidoreductase (DUF2520 family)
MKIGFIGAGKVGFTMGKFLTAHQVEVSGYYSKSPSSSEEAAAFTGTRQYLQVNDLIQDSDALFLTVPDDVITEVWEVIREFPIQNKLICHFSGALSSGIFSGIEHTRAYGYSIHPLFAIHDRYESWKEISEAFFTVEGNEEHIEEIRDLLDRLYREMSGPAHFQLRKNGASYADPLRECGELYPAFVTQTDDLFVGIRFVHPPC